MFQRLLVPLDGSRLAESALPAAFFLAQKAGSTISLLHIIEKDAPQSVHGDRHLTSADEAHAYLADIAARIFPASIRVVAHVHELETKNVARGIADHLLELNQDTVVMSAHGHGGLRDMLFGNIAQQVVALGTMPVLLAREDGGPFACRRILLPHDGVPEHEPALQAGIQMACLASAEVKLVMVIPTAGTLRGAQAAMGQMLPRATRAMLELAQEEGVAHLRAHVAELCGQGTKADFEVIRGDPAACIIKAAKQFAAEVVVLGTHGKSGAKAFWEGSVASRVAAKSSSSLLFIPVGKSSG
ncbi:MAG: universal stress protein [Lentisphaerota bacterium]